MNRSVCEIFIKVRKTAAWEKVREIENILGFSLRGYDSTVIDPGLDSCSYTENDLRKAADKLVNTLKENVLFFFKLTDMSADRTYIYYYFGGNNWKTETLKWRMEDNTNFFVQYADRPSKDFNAWVNLIKPSDIDKFLTRLKREKCYNYTLEDYDRMNKYIQGFYDDEWSRYEENDLGKDDDRDEDNIWDEDDDLDENDELMRVRRILRNRSKSSSDVGDNAGVKGEVFKTKHDQISIIGTTNNIINTEDEYSISDSVWSDSQNHGDEIDFITDTSESLIKDDVFDWDRFFKQISEE